MEEINSNDNINKLKEYEYEYSKKVNNSKSKYPRIIMYNFTLCIILVNLYKVLPFYLKKKNINIKKSNNAIFFAFLNFVGIISLIIIPNSLLFNINPIKHFRERRELEDNIIIEKEKEGHYDSIINKILDGKIDIDKL